MKFTLAASFLAAASAVAAESIFFAVHEASSGNQLGVLVDKHEMAGSNFFFMDSNPAFYDFDPATGAVSTTGGNVSFKLGMTQLPSGKFWALLATVGGTGQPLVTDASGKVTNYNFWACKNVDEPHKYSAKNAAILVTSGGNSTAPASSCTSVNIFKKAVRTPTNTNNGTWTSYTTYCPTPTVITITSCDTVCIPTAITVTTATTISCDQCLVPVSPTKPGILAPTTIPASKTLSVYNGAAGKATMGAAGAFAAVAALLL